MERAARRHLEARPDDVVVVLDANNLARNLYLATQVIELGHPTLIALNMVDVAEANGQSVDAAKLSELLGVPGPAMPYLPTRPA